MEPEDEAHAVGSATVEVAYTDSVMDAETLEDGLCDSVALAESLSAWRRLGRAGRLNAAAGIKAAAPNTLDTTAPLSSLVVANLTFQHKISIVKRIMRRRNKGARQAN
jgi:hypothetical protein